MPRYFLILLLILFSLPLYPVKVAGIPRSHADSLASRQVVYDGRVVTFSTVSYETMLKLYGSEKYRGLTAEQAIASLILYPEEWKMQPIMRVKDKWLREELGLRNGYSSMTDLFDSGGNYRLDRMMEASSGDPRRERALRELDEKAGLMLLLWSGALFEPYPEDGILHLGSSDGKGEGKVLRVEPLSEARVRGELFYNRFPAGKILFMLLFSAALTGFTVWLTRWSLMPLAIVLQWLALALAIWQYAMIWWLGGHVPLGSMQDTLLLMVIVMLLLVIVSVRILPCKESAMALMVCGWLGCGAFALVAWLNARNPAVSALSPMLSSPWLSIHVTLMMVSYALLVMCSVGAIALLIAGEGGGKGNMDNVVRILLWPGVILLGAGIFTGSAWASTAWGRWWAWDPKETFALVCFIVYMLPLIPQFRRKAGTTGTNIYVALALLTILMTYFGVNYLPSIHAYTR